MSTDIPEIPLPLPSQDPNESENRPRIPLHPPRRRNMPDKKKNKEEKRVIIIDI